MNKDILRPPLMSAQGFIYFIACRPARAVKIGYATNPARRLSEIQTGCPADLELVGYVRASIKDERKLHRTFEPVHLRGEWYSIKGKLADVMALIEDKGPGQIDRISFDAIIVDGTFDDGFSGPWTSDLQAYRASAIQGLWL